MNYRIYYPKNGKNWSIEDEAYGKKTVAKSVLILRDSEAIAEKLEDDTTRFYILVTGATKEVHGDVLVLK